LGRQYKESPVLVVTISGACGTLSWMAVVEFTRFAIPQDRTEALVAAHSAMVATLAAACVGFQQACLVELGEDEWIDITIWETEAAADAAIVRVSAMTGFFGLIDRILGQERGTTISDRPG
jgi:hypothetical protein